MGKTMETASLYESIHPRYPELSGQVAIVTGSSRGIGKGIAIRLAREGMKVVINSRTPEAVEATAAELCELGAEALAVPADVGRTEDVNRLFEETLRAFGSVGLLVNNAANLRRLHFFEVDESLLDDELASNIRGPYMCSYRAAEVMREAGSEGDSDGRHGGRWEHHPHQFCGRVAGALAGVALRRHQRRDRRHDPGDGSGISGLWGSRQRRSARGDLHRATFSPGPLAHGGSRPADTPEAFRYATRNRCDSGIPGLARCGLHHRSDHLR